MSLVTAPLEAPVMRGGADAHPFDQGGDDGGAALRVKARAKVLPPGVKLGRKKLGRSALKFQGLLL